jgi:diacylglycerol kinase (ATP)
MKRKIIYIINPISGTRTKADLQQLCESKAKERDIPFHIYPSVASGDYSFLRTIIKNEGITDVIIAGGDGTISQVVGSLMDVDVDFGVIPSGSGNGLAYSLKIPKQPSKALDIVFSGKATSLDGFFVNRRFACMLGGLGFDAKVAHDFADQPKRGLGTYIRLSLKNFFAMKPHHFDLAIKDVKLSVEAYFISFANSNQFGNNFTIAPKASLSDGLLDIVIVTGQNKVSFLLETLKQMAGWNKLQSDSLIRNKKGIIYFQTDKLTINNAGLAPLHIDGEPVESPDKLVIEVKKKCFKLIHPAL